MINNRIESLKILIKKPFWDEFSSLSSNDDWWSFCHEIAHNQDEIYELAERNVSFDELFVLSKTKDSVVKKILASTTDNKDILGILSKDEQDLGTCESVRSIVAGNTFTSIETLREMSSDCDPYVRMAVAKNENTPLDVLYKLHKDTCFSVIENVIKNYNANCDLIECITDFLCNKKKKYEEGNRSEYFHPNIFQVIIDNEKTSKECLIKINEATTSFWLGDVSIKISLLKSNKIPESIRQDILSHHDIKYEFEHPGSLARLYID